MLFNAVTTLAVAALAGQAIAEPARKPYQPSLARMTLRSTLGHRGDDGLGYQTDSSVCGTGATCAEACGAGFEQCASSDNAVHCFNAGASSTCCPDNSGCTLLAPSPSERKPC
jgi:hypothetical protein